MDIDSNLVVAQVPFFGAKAPSLNIGGNVSSNCHHTAYFDRQISSVGEFWRRVGIDPSLSGKRVLELGCGHGTMSLDLAKRGADAVVGVDLDQERIDFANSHVASIYPKFASQIRFSSSDICDLPASEDGTFHLIVSKDTFEHIFELEKTLAQVRRLLKPGGKLIVGISPLYYSPYGDHGRYLGAGFPWATLIPERWLFALASKWSGEKIRHANDAGLNKMTPKQFRDLFSDTEWTIKSLRYNVGNKRGMGLFKRLRVLPFVEKYFTISIYAVVERR